METKVKKAFFVIFCVFSAISGLFIVSAFIAWLERKMYSTAHMAVNNQRGSLLAEAEATAMMLFRRLVASQYETDEE